MKKLKILMLVVMLIALGFQFSGCFKMNQIVKIGGEKGVEVGSDGGGNGEEGEDTEEFSTFMPPSITRLCPTKIGGDSEFAGHGPDVEAYAALKIMNSNTEIWVELYLHVKETLKDWTEAEGTWNRKLWTVEQGYSIIEIVSSHSSNASYCDVDHDLDRPSVLGGTLVERFEIMGDTGGNDIGNCTDDDVFMNVYFNEVRVKVKRI